MMEPPLVPREHQERTIGEAQKILRAAKSLLIASPTGSGKCHPAGTAILMYDGSTRTVEDVRAGDRLMGPDSRPRNVSSTSQGYGPIMEIIPTRGEPWRCNDEHILTLVRTSEPDDPKTSKKNRDGEIVELSVREYLQKSRHFRQIHKLFQPEEVRFDNPKDQRELLIPPYILGALLGDGDLTNGRVGITTMDDEIIQAFEKYAEQIQVRLAHAKDPSRTSSHYLRKTDTAGTNPALNHCRTLGIAERNAGDKFIPARYRTAGIRERLEILAGLMDAGGRLTDNGYDCISKSRALAEDTSFVARSVGLRANISEKKIDGESCWRLHISGNTGRIPCRIERKQAGPRGQKKNLLRMGFQVRETRPEDYYGFTLDGDGRYLLGSFTVTHNTICIAEIAARALRKDNRTAVLVHRQELVEQSEEKVARQCQMNPGVVWKGRREWDQPITIIAQDTLAAAEIPREFHVDILMVDEAHHTVAPGWLRSIQRINPRFLIGFTATPFRQDREPLSPHPFEEVIRPVTPIELIGMKLLCPAVIESLVVHDRQGEQQRINQARNVDEIYLQAVRYAIGQGRSRILLYASQTQTESPRQVITKTTSLLQSAGVNAGAIHQNISSKRRKSELIRFQKSASASVLLNYLALTEGTDLPNVDCVIIGRQTESESTIIQMIGRGLRPHDQKENCLVLDFTGRPDMSEIVHYWRMDGPPEEKEKSKRGKVKSNTPAELVELAARFPSQVSMMENTRIDYPWFKPFDNRNIMVLPVWSGQNEAGCYVTVEPTKSGGWTFNRIVLNDHGPSPVRREQSQLKNPDDAAARVRMALGDMAPRIQRSAAWRQNEVSENQMRTWNSIHRDGKENATPLTAGEAWDAISRERFLKRVSLSLL